MANHQCDSRISNLTTSVGHWFFPPSFKNTDRRGQDAEIFEGAQLVVAYAVVAGRLPMIDGGRAGCAKHLFDVLSARQQALTPFPQNSDQVTPVRLFLRSVGKMLKIDQETRHSPLQRRFGVLRNYCLRIDKEGSFSQPGESLAKVYLAQLNMCRQRGHKNIVEMLVSDTAGMKQQAAEEIGWDMMNSEYGQPDLSKSFLQKAQLCDEWRSCPEHRNRGSDVVVPFAVLPKYK